MAPKTNPQALVSALRETLRQHRDGDVLSACKAMVDFLKAPERTRRATSLGICGACDELTRVLAMRDIDVRAVALIVASSLADVPDNARRFVQLGACPKVVGALRAHGERQEDVAICGCEMIINLARVSGDAANSMIDAGVCEMVVDALRAFGETSIGVAHQGCWAVYQLVHAVPEAAAERFRRVNGHVCVIAAIRALATPNITVADAGLAALDQLVFHSKVLDQVVACQGLRLVVEVAERHAQKLVTMAVSSSSIFAVAASSGENGGQKYLPLLWELRADVVCVSALESFGTQKEELTASALLALSRMGDVADPLPGVAERLARASVLVVSNPARRPNRGHRHDCVHRKVGCGRTQRGNHTDRRWFLRVRGRGLDAVRQD